MQAFEKQMQGFLCKMQFLHKIYRSPMKSAKEITTIQRTHKHSHSFFWQTELNSAAVVLPCEDKTSKDLHPYQWVNELGLKDRLYCLSNFL